VPENAGLLQRAEVIINPVTPSPGYDYPGYYAQEKEKS